MYDNRKMSDILGMGLVSTRRYCFQFLGADAAAGLHDGVARTLSRRDAFRVCLGVNLIQEGRFTLEESKKLVAILGPVIEKKKLLPEFMPEPPWERVEVIIYKADNEAGFFLELKTLKKHTREKQAGRGIWSEVYQREEINFDPSTGASPIFIEHFSVTFNLTSLVHGFLISESAGMGRAQG